MSGDMMAAMYDPHAVQADAFDSANHSFLQNGTGAVVRPALLKMRDAISVLDFGAVGNGSADDSSAFQKAAVLGTRIVVPPGIYRIGTPVVLSEGSVFEGVGAAQSKIVAATAGQHLFEGVDLSRVKLTGLSLRGYGLSSTMPLASVGGLTAVTTGLATFVRCTDVRISECEMANFYSAICALYSDRLWVEKNFIHNWYVFGALSSTSRQWWIDRNVFIDCDQLGGRMPTHAPLSVPITPQVISFAADRSAGIMLRMYRHGTAS